MGYRGKTAERERARELRAEAWTLQDIATELGVAKSSVSLWVRDVAFTPRPRNRGNNVTRPHPLHLARLDEIEETRRWAHEVLGDLSPRDRFLAGIGLYAGDGAKVGLDVRFANSDPDLVRFFCSWLREFFDVDESRLRVRLYLHEGLDLEAATVHWQAVTGIPASQFQQPYRAAADATRRKTKHVYGCCHVGFGCARTKRKVLGLLEALVSWAGDPG